MRIKINFKIMKLAQIPKNKIVCRFVKTTGAVSVSHSNLITEPAELHIQKSAKLSTPELPCNLGVSGAPWWSATRVYTHTNIQLLA